MYQVEGDVMIEDWDKNDGVPEKNEEDITFEKGSILPEDDERYAAGESGARSTTVRSYLREMGRHPLLNRAEEIELSRQIEHGRQTMLKGVGLTRLGSKTLADELDRVLNGDVSLERVIFSGPDGQKSGEDDVVKRLKRARRALNSLAKTSKRESAATRRKKADEASRILTDLRFDPSRLEDVSRDVLNLGNGKSLAEKDLKTAQKTIREGWDEMEKGRERMVQGNLRLVVSVARRYRSNGLDMSDLIQEGNLGLLKAVDRFDHRKGCKFSTYAVWWIRQTIRRAITAHVRPVRLPANVAELVTKMRNVSDDLRQDLQREPFDEEIAEALDITPEHVEMLKKVIQGHVSLDAPLGEDGETVVGHLIPDENAVPPTDEVSKKMLSGRLDDVLKTLPEREETILRLRYGIGGKRAWTLEEVADRFGVTRERIRQLEVRALRKMRHPRRAVHVKSFLN